MIDETLDLSQIYDDQDVRRLELADRRHIAKVSGMTLAQVDRLLLRMGKAWAGRDPDNALVPESLEWEDPAYPDDELEDKGIRRVRTPEGRERYDQEIGTIIVPHPRRHSPRSPRGPDWGALMADLSTTKLGRTREDATNAVLGWLHAPKATPVAPPPQYSRTLNVANTVAPDGVTDWPANSGFALYTVDETHFAINDALRGDRPDSLNRLGEAAVDVMTADLEAAPPRNVSNIAWRGLSLAEPPEVGDVIIDKGFVSMAWDRENAEHFAIGRAAGVGAYAELMTREPNRLPPVMVKVLIGPNEKVKTDGAFEVIAQHGSRFEIVGKDADGTLTAVLHSPDVEPVPDALLDSERVEIDLHFAEQFQMSEDRISDYNDDYEYDPYRYDDEDDY